VNQALRAHKLFTRDVDYIVKDDKVVIIDEFTGRMMSGPALFRRVHQALEAKEHVTIQQENQTLASITFQNYFRMYPKLAGMTGNGDDRSREFGESTSWTWSRCRPTRMSCARTRTTESIGPPTRKNAAIITLIEDALTASSRCWWAPCRSRNRSIWRSCCANGASLTPS